MLDKYLSLSNYFKIHFSHFSKIKSIPLPFIPIQYYKTLDQETWLCQMFSSGQHFKNFTLDTFFLNLYEFVNLNSKPVGQKLNH